MTETGAAREGGPRPFAGSVADAQKPALIENASIALGPLPV